MEEVKIITVTLADVQQLQQISKQTFQETFSSDNTEENMKKYLEEGYTIQKLKEELNNPDSAFYFAMTNNNVIGYLKINTGQAQTELKDENSLEIERIYVLKEYLGKKVGQLLYKETINIAKNRNADFIWLGVWEENNRAINFYKKNGFVAFDKHIFKLGDDEQTDIMMKLLLK